MNIQEATKLAMEKGISIRERIKMCMGYYQLICSVINA